MKVQKSTAVKVVMTEEDYEKLLDSFHNEMHVEASKTVRMDMTDQEYSVIIEALNFTNETLGDSYPEEDNEHLRYRVIALLKQIMKQ